MVAWYCLHFRSVHSDFIYSMVRAVLGSETGVFPLAARRLLDGKPPCDRPTVLGPGVAVPVISGAPVLLSSRGDVSALAARNNYWLLSSSSAACCRGVLAGILWSMLLTAVTVCGA